MRVRGLELLTWPPGDYLTDVIAATGDFFEAEILDDVAARLRALPAGVLVDAGAMIGNHTLYLAAFAPHTLIHAFEPEAGNYARLVWNVRDYPAVRCYRSALSDHSGHGRMAIDPANHGHAWLTAPGVGSQRVTVRTLDSYGLRDVRLLKIDVEGHERHVLAGARDTIAASHPLILIEDWAREYGALLPGYQLAAEWERAHQTYLYAWAG